MTATVRSYWDDRDFGFADPGDGGEHIYFRKEALPAGISWVMEGLSLRRWRIEGWVVIRDDGEYRGRRAFRTAWLLPADGRLGFGPEPQQALDEQQKAAIWNCLGQLGGQAWLPALLDRCGDMTQPAISHEFHTFGEGDPGSTVVQLPGWDMLGRNRHGGRVPTHNSWGHGKGGGKGGRGGSGLAALPDAPQDAPGQTLWEHNGWTRPGHTGAGTVGHYVARVRSGFVFMDDRGPDVHFNPEHLDPALAELLRTDALIHTRVRVRVVHRPNGRSRHTDQVTLIPDGEDRPMGGGGAA